MKVFDQNMLMLVLGLFFMCTLSQLYGADPTDGFTID